MYSKFFESGILLIFLIGFHGCQEPSQIEHHNLTEEEVTETVRVYDDAWSKKDTATVGSIQGKDYIYFSSKGGVRPKQWMLNDLLGNPDYQIENIERSELIITLYDNTAIVGSRWQGTGSYGDQPINDDQRCSQVFVKKESRVYLASEHCTNIES